MKIIQILLVCLLIKNLKIGLLVLRRMPISLNQMRISSNTELPLIVLLSSQILDIKFNSVDRIPDAIAKALHGSNRVKRDFINWSSVSSSATCTWSSTCLLPVMVGCIQNGLRLLTKKLRRIKKVIDKDGSSKTKTLNPRIELRTHISWLGSSYIVRH